MGGNRQQLGPGPQGPGVMPGDYNQQFLMPGQQQGAMDPRQRLQAWWQGRLLNHPGLQGGLPGQGAMPGPTDPRAGQQQNPLVGLLQMLMRG